MTSAFPRLDEIGAIARKTEHTEADLQRIREILQTWPSASLAMMHRTLSN